MVGRGEVDADLQGEVANECAKYGPVVGVVVDEAPDGERDSAPVHIFVEFAKQDAAVRGFREMNGRFFDGRSVRCGFHDVARYQAGDLDPA